MLVDTLNRLRNLKTGKDASEEDVQRAETLLGLKFCDEYRNYLKMLGWASAEGVKLTGIAKSRRSVVYATNTEKALGQKIPDNMYVVEYMAIPRMCVLQDTDGKIYYISPTYEPKKSFNSLEEYILATKNLRM